MVPVLQLHSCIPYQPADRLSEDMQLQHRHL
jgi:hypothetical protein